MVILSNGTFLRVLAPLPQPKIHVYNNSTFWPAMPSPTWPNGAWVCHWGGGLKSRKNWGSG